MKKLIPALFIILLLSYFASATIYKIRYSLDCDSLIYADSSVIFDSTTSAKTYWDPATSEIRTSISGYVLLRLGADTVFVDTLLQIEELIITDDLTVQDTTTLDEVVINDGLTVDDTASIDELSVEDGLTLNDTLTTTETFVWRLGCLAFASGQTIILNELAAHPTNLNGSMFATCAPVPTELFSANFVLDQITVYYTSDDSLDIFDFYLLRTDRDGTSTADVTVDSIGYNSEGAQDSTMLAVDLTLSDFAYAIQVDVNGTDANTDVKVYEIEFKGHLEK